LWFLFILTVTWIGYAAVTAVTDGDTLTSTIWNEMKEIVNNNEIKLTNITSSWTDILVSGNINAKNTLKAYASFNWDASVIIYDSYWINNIVRESEGIYIITWATPFVNDFYVVQWACNMRWTSGTKFGLEGNNIDGNTYEWLTTTSVRIGCRDSTNGWRDSDLIHITAYGVQ